MMSRHLKKQNSYGGNYLEAGNTLQWKNIGNECKLEDNDKNLTQALRKYYKKIRKSKEIKRRQNGDKI